MFQKNSLPVKTESFVGPIDLLLRLLQEDDLPISKLSLTSVTNQYLDYVIKMQDLNFELASDFLVIAATLILMKSRALLPPTKDQSEEETLEAALSPEELLRRLAEHKRFREAGETLGTRPRLGEDVFKRQGRKAPIERFWKEMNVTGLTITYQSVLERSRRRTHVLRKETVSISDKILEFKARLPILERLEFESLLQNSKSRPERVATFMAILELSRLKRARLYQEGTYTTLWTEIIESLQDFDLHFANQLDEELRSSVEELHTKEGTA